MAWTTALTDLRDFLGDGQTTKSVWRQALLGECNGVNVLFKAFNIRLVVDPLPVVYVDGVEAPFIVANQLQGEVTITTPPAAGSRAEISGYHFYWTDDELNGFLRNAAGMLIETEDFTGIVPGLKLAALHYASSQAFNNLSVRYLESLSSQYQLSERKDADKSACEAFSLIAERHQKEGANKRDEYYKRLGKREQPAFGTCVAASYNYTPNR